MAVLVEDWFQQTRDFQECFIATPVLNGAYGPMRDVHYWCRLFLGLQREGKYTPQEWRVSLTLPLPSSPPKIIMSASRTTRRKATVHERVRDLLFDYQAGSFLQINDNVLVPLTSCPRRHLPVHIRVELSTHEPPRGPFLRSRPVYAHPRPTLQTSFRHRALRRHDPLRDIQRTSTASRTSSHSVLATRGVDLQRGRRISSLTVLLRVWYGNCSPFPRRPWFMLGTMNGLSWSAGEVADGRENEKTLGSLL
ncbi:hypothetical protein BC826DRAFT_970274 [Russula brevipes]|nr:hypothetical protein BC826DRAFT_970274 [Russula brevipes]